MKIADMSENDGDCQIEAVITPQEKKTKQARLPFQTLSSDVPVTNKKRKLSEITDSRNPKVPKVNTKENALKKSNKTDIEEIILLDDDITEDKTIDNNRESGTTPESKKKKSTPVRSQKSKKTELRVQLTPLTKFFKKCDNVDKIQKTDEPKKESSVNSNTKPDKKFEDTKNQNGEQVKETHKDLDEKSIESVSKKDGDDFESKDNENESGNESSSSSDEDEKLDVDSSSKDNEKMDVDSDIDDSASDTDKRTEHEDTDSRDDTKRNIDTKLTSSNKLLDSTKSKKLTPKQLEKKLEIQKKRDIREKQRLEREKKLQEEREMRKKEKEEKKREREEKDKALKEQKKKEKELKEQKKQAELEQKQKEKEAKEEDRRKREEAKEEEKRKKEEERLEAERKKQKLASNFVSFFVSKKTTEIKPVKEEIKEVVKSNFMPFEIKADMRIAPVTRRNLTDEEKSKLDKLMTDSVKSKSELYVEQLKNKQFNVRKSERTWPVEANDDIQIIEDEEEVSSNVVQPSIVVMEKHRAKLFLFNENRRPPYWGTWSKKSTFIKPRRPFATDTKWFDYEVDSDDEWEEEEPGESLRGSDDEKEEDPEDNEYDVDNDFMVPHGYLSDEEIMADEEECDEDDDLNPEKQKTKLKILNEQFEAERKQKTTKLHPKVIGCFWLKADNTYPDNTPSYAVRFLNARQAWVGEIPASLNPPTDGDLNSENTASSVRKAETLEEAVPDLIRLLHGNTNSQKFLIMEFLEYWSKKKADKRPLPKMRLKEKVRELASYIPCPEIGPQHEKSMWYVPEETRKKYLDDEILSLPNNWTYSLTPKKKVKLVEFKEKQIEKNEEKKEEEKKTLSRITQFTKTLTAEKMQKQLAEKSLTSSTSKSGEKSLTSVSVIKATPPSARPLKRVALISLPRETKSPRVSLIDQFVTKNGSNVADDKKVEKSPIDDTEDDDIQVIDNSDEIIVTSVTEESEEKNDSTDKSQSSKEDEKTNKTDNTSCNSDVEIMIV